jgi:sugar phosphate isomerase/epimerase
MHVNDNFGIPQLDETSDQAENLAQGLGDLHLVPGWGTVPFDDIVAIPFPRTPVVILELRPAYADHLALAAERTRDIAARIGGS